MALGVIPKVGHTLLDRAQQGVLVQYQFLLIMLLIQMELVGLEMQVTKALK